MTHKEKHLENSRRNKDDKMKERYNKKGKYNRRKIDNKNSLIEQEVFLEKELGKKQKKKWVDIQLDD